VHHSSTATLGFAYDGDIGVKELCLKTNTQNPLSLKQGMETYFQFLLQEFYS